MSGTEASTGAFDGRSIPALARESLWYAGDGLAIRRIDWEAPPSGVPRGGLLFLPGRGDCYEKYLETLDEWHRQGWQVTSLDWRGQALSGRLGLDGTTGHVEDFADWVADLAAFWTQWCEQVPGPHVCVAHSMGGHVALRAAAEKKIDPAALVLVAPMLGVGPELVPTWLLHPLGRMIAGLGDRRRPAWKFSEKPGAAPKARIELLTHDESRYADEAWWREQRPELEMGPASWGWIAAALASIRGLEGGRMLERVELPVLILATSADRLVSWSAIRRAAKRLPHAQLVAFGAEARHEILREVRPVRERALAAIDRFLEGAASAAAARSSA